MPNLSSAATVAALLFASLPLTGLNAQGRGGVGTGTAPVSALETLGRIGPIIRDGVMQPVAEFADTAQLIRQRVWVETDYDTDRDGKLDRIHVDIVRPGAAEKAGLKLPVLMKQSPYLGPTNGSANWNVEQELGAPSPVRTPPPYRPFQENRPIRPAYQSWVARGFIALDAENAGTGLSTGCPSSGDVTERRAPVFVIKWLNGKARAYTTVDGNEAVSAANWTNGKVGMYGTSYEGAMPMAAAVEGVEGLKAIIPASPNTSNYRYYRSYGLVRSPGGYLGEDVDVLYDFVHSGNNRDACNRIWRDGILADSMDRATGDFSPFWQERDQTRLIGNVQAAVLFAHGFNDWNVMPDNTIRMWEALKGINSKAKLYMHQGGHGGMPPQDVVDKWWAHYLWDVDNGVDTLPRVMVVPSTAAPAGRGGRGAVPAPGTTQPSGPVFYSDWPVPGSQAVRLYPQAGGNALGKLALENGSSRGVEKLVDDWRIRPAEMALSAESPNRLLYALPELTDSLHLSGTAVVTLKLASSKPAANLSVYLVTLPYDRSGIGSAGERGVVTRGWADPQNWKSLTGSKDYTSLTPGEPLVPGQFQTMTFPLQPDDQIILPGQQLGLMILSSDNGFTLHPAPGTELSIDLAGSSITLPVVGGAAALQKALKR